MATHRKTNNSGPEQKEWYVHCSHCGTEQRMAMAFGSTKKQKRPLCLGCREFLPPTDVPYKK